LSKILDPPDGRGVVVAADHGFMLGSIEGVEDLEGTLSRVVEGRPDAILLSPGQAARLNHLFRGRDAPALLVRADWTNAFRDKTYTLPARTVHRRAVAEARDAISLGASAIVTYYFMGHSDDEREAQNLRLMASFARQCDKMGLPLIVEPLPMGERVTGANFADLATAAVRIAAEAGADAIKAVYTGDVETFSSLVKAAGIPVLILGGAKAKTLRDALEIVDEALEAGAAGVVYGRQVLQASDPAQFVRSVRAIVHEGKTVLQVLNPVTGPVRLRVFPERCTRCRVCELICTSTHGQGFSPAAARLRVEFLGVDSYKPVTCTLCGQCIKACPTDALSFHPELHYVQLNPERCNGCMDCVQACPVKVVRFDEQRSLPIICDMCRGAPSCGLWCQPEAIVTERQKERKNDAA